MDFNNQIMLRKLKLKELNTPKREYQAGCKMCFITLNCGTQFIIKSIIIRSDLDNCDKTSEQRISVKLADLMSHLLSEMPDLTELPYFESTDAGVKLLREIACGQI